MVDVWTHGNAYDRFMGRWSRKVAPAFLDWLEPDPGLRWADVGCGSGALTEAVLHGASPASVLALDPAPAQVEEAARRLDDDRTTFACATADALAPGTQDLVVSGLVLNFVEAPVDAVRGMAGAVSGAVSDRASDRASVGIVAAYVWDYAEGMQMLRLFWDTACSLDPAVATLNEGRRFGLADRDALVEVWSRAGLSDIGTTAIVVPTTFTDLEDYWNPFLGGQGPAPGYVATLAAGAREELRLALAERLPRAQDGSIPLTARAWAVRGSVA